MKVGLAAKFRVAHASRVLVSASRRNSLFFGRKSSDCFVPEEKIRVASTPLPIRERRTLPGHERPNVAARSIAAARDANCSPIAVVIGAVPTVSQAN
jgi:hypothetical protein